MDESQRHHTKWRKSVSKVDILYDSVDKASGKGRTIGLKNRSAVARGWTRGECLAETGQPERVLRGDRTALYTDCGGGCSNLYVC